MVTPPTGLPPPSTIQALLRTTTERLANALARPSAELPEWTRQEWLVAKAAAAIHGVSPLLSRQLRWQGPADWVEFLAHQRQQTASRHARVEALLRLIDARASDAGIAIIALKGAALHRMRIYDPGERPMADLDLLVKPGDVARTSRLLEDLGYRESWTYWKHISFVPQGLEPDSLGEHSDTPVKIELHQRICEILPHRITDVSRFVFNANARPGINTYESNAALMTHLLLHAAGAMAYRRLRLINLHDIALLARRMTDSDWAEFLGHGAERIFWWAVPPLRLTDIYYAQAIPGRVLAALEPHCSRLLRHISRRRLLSDTSLSYIWMEAFPGLEWAQSPLEAISYVAARIVPDKDTLAMRAALGKERWAANDSSYRISHVRRILRFCLTRATRPASLYSVRMALLQQA